MAKTTFANVFHTSKLGPNNLQFAIAQYATGKTYAIPHQIWTIPAGQGKSRVSHAMALLALALGLVPRVFMVFCNNRLRDRDLEEYAQFWELSGYQNKIFYQVGLDFERTGCDLLVIDESDTLIFDNPTAFGLMLKRSRCICMTATPDDNDARGAER